MRIATSLGCLACLPLCLAACPSPLFGGVAGLSIGVGFRGRNVRILVLGCRLVRRGCGGSLGCRCRLDRFVLLNRRWGSLDGFVLLHWGLDGFVLLHWGGLDGCDIWWLIFLRHTVWWCGGECTERSYTFSGW